MRIGRRGRRSTHTPAGRLKSAVGSVPAAARRPISNGLAESTITAVSGIASRVIWSPKSEIVSPIHSFRKSGSRARLGRSDMRGTVAWGTMPTLVDETTDLLQQLIRNECVNDGTAASGHEVRSVDTLEAYLRTPGVEMERYEPSPGRGNLVLRIDGTDKSAPSLHLMGHMDVVPVNRDGWRHDPFGGELIEGEVWGRGAIDMLDVTASMAVAIRRLLSSGFHPRGTLIYSAVADEEAMGTHGAKWLVDNKWDDVKSDYMVTEFGGARFPIGGGGTTKLPIMTAEKGSQWTRLRVKGTPRHRSMPHHSDNAPVKASQP